MAPMNAPNPEDLPFAQRAGLIRQASTAVARQPKNVTAHFNLAMLLKADKQYGIALKHLKKARKLAPNDLEILVLLAEISLEVRDLVPARKYARILCEKYPRNLDCRMFYADVLQNIGKPDLAIKQYEIVLKQEPNHPDVLNKMAQVERMKGNISGVNEIQDTLHEITPLNAGNIYSEANNRKNTQEECDELEARIVPALERIEAIEETESFKEADKKPIISHLSYARGKIWSDVKNYDKAFEAYKTANDIIEQAKAETDKTVFDNMKAAFTKQLLKSKADHGIKTKGPIFILGMPRSGTTLTESICGAHSKITAGDELTHISSLSSGLGESTTYVDAFVKAISNLSKSEVTHLADVYLAKTSQHRTSTPYSTDKMPHNFLRMGLIKLLLPNASIIHCRRHPIDNCVSLYTNSMSEYHGSYKSDLTKLGLYYRQYSQLMQFWRDNIPGGFHEVYYEDVVANTELNARKMIEYIGLDWEDGVLDRQKSQKSVRTLSAWQVRQPVYTSSAGRWKNYEKHLGPLIDALGPVVSDYEAELAALND